MQIRRFIATKVHGYIDFDLRFDPSLNFLVGLNGCGKTTALNILVALVDPNVRLLAELDFESAEIEFTVNETIRTVRANKTPERFEISINGNMPPFHMGMQRLLLMLREAPDRELILMQNPTLREIRELPTPLYLGLDRRFTSGGSDDSGDSDSRTPRRIVRRTNLSSSLDDVQDLVRDAILAIRNEQAALDNEFRKRIIFDSFVYTPFSQPRSVDPDSLRQFRRQKESLENAARTLGVSYGEVESRINKFLDSMESITKSVHGIGLLQSKKVPEKEIQQRFERAFEYYVNRTQMDRIIGLFTTIEKHMEVRKEANRPVDQFLELVNGFLGQTGKQIAISDENYLAVRIGDVSQSRGLHSLSSGERQIVVMIANLSLNRRVKSTGVFIVDEPELSLHMAWQEMFVNAIKKASPQTQLILATHSPAIVLGLDEYCVHVPNGEAHASMATKGA